MQHTYPSVDPMTPSHPHMIEYLTEGKRESWSRISSRRLAPSKRELARVTYIQSQCSGRSHPTTPAPKLCGGPGGSHPTTPAPKLCGGCLVQIPGTQHLTAGYLRNSLGLILLISQFPCGETIIPTCLLSVSWSAPTLPSSVRMKFLIWVSRVVRREEPSRRSLNHLNFRPLVMSELVLSQLTILRGGGNTIIQCILGLTLVVKERLIN